MPRTTEATQVQVVIPKELEQEITLLRGLRDLMAERVGYAMGAKALSKEMSNATKEQRMASNEARKFLRENLENFIRNGDYEGYQKAVEKVNKASETLKEAKAPHLAKITPLKRAVRYIDDIAVPSFLTTLGKTPQAIFTPASWVVEKIEEEKKKRKSKKE
jgi:flagellar biosynthesis/type III secretory pathway protein FliH